MKTKNHSKKKNLLHFTLAVTLIIGVWFATNANSNSSSNDPGSFSRDIHSVDSDVADEQNIPSDKNEVITDSDLKTIELGTFSEVDIDEISAVRGRFDVTNADEVKNVQRILGLEQDGLFGPKNRRGKVMFLKLFRPSGVV